MTTFKTLRVPNNIERKSDPLAELKDAFGGYHAEVKKIGERLASLEAGTEGFVDLKNRLEMLETRAARPGAASGDGRRPLTGPGVDEFKAFMVHGVKAIQTTVDADGGYAVPTEIDSMIRDQLRVFSPLRRLADVVPVRSPDFKRMIGVRGATTGWVGETDARSETNTPQLGEVAPTFGTIYAYPKATEESLREMIGDPESWLLRNVSEELGIAEGAAFASGNGTKKPTGFLAGTPVPTADGARAFGTLQYVASGGAAGFATSNPSDALISLVYKVRSAYRVGPGVAWLMNSATLASVRTFKDGNGNYLWQPPLVAGQPGMLLGFPVEEDPNMPDVAANAFPIAFGNWRRGYVIADLADTRVTRDEVTTPGYVKFYVRRRVGGKVADSDAIKLLKIATS